MNKTPKQLERYFKGAANHRRIAILKMVGERSGITVEQIANSLKANIKTISQHTHYLVRGGLLNKTHVGRSVSHELSPYGHMFLKFINTF